METTITEKNVKQLSSFSSRYNTLKLVSFSMLFVLVIVFALSGYFVSQAYETASSRIYVVAPQGVFMADANSDYKVSPYELRSHVLMFVQNMFQFDASNFEENVNRALYLTDKKTAGMVIYKQYQQQDYYKNLVNSNAVVTAKIDSLSIDMSEGEPYKGVAYVQQVFKTFDSKIPVYFGLQFEISVTPRSELNPHGLKIQNLLLFKYNPADLQAADKSEKKKGQPGDKEGKKEGESQSGNNPNDKK